MHRKKKPLARKPDIAPNPDADLRHTRRRRNSWEPQVIVPQQVDLPLNRPEDNEVVVPPTVNGRF